MNSYRILTVRQPWADLIMAGVKDVENRAWAVPSTLPHHYACDRCETQALVDDVRCAACQSDQLRPDGPFPFTLGIHAAKTFDWDALDPACQPNATRESYRLDSDARGVLLGTVQVTGCHHADDPECIEVYSEGEDTYGREIERFGPCSRWAEPDTWHLALADPQPLDEPIPAKGRLGLWTLPAEVPA